MKLNPVISKEIKINNRIISPNHAVYFIADLASNHNGELERAKDLIYSAKEAGADAVKFQHFLAEKIVSDYGFKSLGSQKSHQSTWKKSVYEIYKNYETNRIWNDELIATCKLANIEFLTTPYDFDAIEMFSKLIPAFKIGSGDITWIEAIEKISEYQKPVLLSTGASDMQDVERAVETIIRINSQIVLMQCNTNYIVDNNNFSYINLNVLKSYALKWPGIILGLSDHTLGHTTVLGAVALGARVIEKHFTTNNSLEGPDHAFSMNSITWKAMVQATRELEMALGDGIKKIEYNEVNTAILQRRSIRLKNSKKTGEKITYADLDFLRPASNSSLPPYMLKSIINRVLKNNKQKDSELYLSDVI